MFTNKMSHEQIQICHGAYSESPQISTELSIPSLYGIHRIDINNHEAEIIIGISLKKIAIEIYLTNEFGEILYLGAYEFIDFLNNLESFFSMNINYVFKPPIMSISRFDYAGYYLIKLLTTKKCI